MYVNKVTLIRPLVKPGKSEFPVKTLHLLVQVVLKKRLQAFISHDLRKGKILFRHSYSVFVFNTHSWLNLVH